MSERNDSIDPNVNVSGRQSYFNEDAKFFKDVYIYGTLYYDFDKNSLTKLGDVSIAGTSNFKGDVYIDGNLDVGILTVRKRLDVGIGGTVLRAIADLQGLPFTSGKVGIANTFPKQTLDVIGTAIISEKVGIGGTTIPEQVLDVSGSVKIDANIFDSVNSPGKNGYQLVKDVRGIRWIAMFTHERATPGVGFGTIVGIQTDGFFVLDEGIPIF
jgi:cytoskeletal protein CcmA (bactofilin family)